jgi:uncharacterized protein YndB with AHSA1/START domain
MTRMERTEQKGLVVSRTFNAPRERVWAAWTEPEKIRRWWGPKGFTAPVIEVDLRVGGKYLYDMRSPDGKDYWSAGVFKDIRRPERITVVDSFADEEGNIVPASYYGLPGRFPLESWVTVTFEDVEGRTKLTISQLDSPAGAATEQGIQGWNESLDKLAEVVES